jgi:two-component system, LuxR family, sensor kinase FixL
VRDVSGCASRPKPRRRDLQERLARVGRFSTMGEMAAGLAHEINQPLAAITTYAQAAERMASQARGRRRGAVRRRVPQDRRSGARAGEVIRRLRGFLRVQECSREAHDLNALVREILMLAELDARARDVPLDVQLAEAICRRSAATRSRSSR